MTLTRRQQEIHAYLKNRLDETGSAPSLDDVCAALGLRSRGSLHKHIQALVAAGLVEPLNGKRRGVRLRSEPPYEQAIPFLGTIAAGQPLEALPQPEYLPVPAFLLTGKPCYVLRVRGDSMIEAGIFDGDFVVIEQREHARNGEIVVALIDGETATLKRLEQRGGKVILHPANAALEPLVCAPASVRIQGVLVAQMRKY